jgi:hypothetical protein
MEQTTQLIISPMIIKIAFSVGFAIFHFTSLPFYIDKQAIKSSNILAKVFFAIIDN